MHERPKIAHGIFQRRAGKNEALAAAQVEGSLRVLRLWIFDMLCFVEHDRIEGESAVKFRVAAKQAVTR